MEILNVQAMLANAGYYTGELDGYYGPQMNRAMRVIELTTQKHQYPKNFLRWGTKRRIIACGQAILNALGFEAGEVDGLLGHNTREAFAAYQLKKETGRDVKLKQKPVEEYATTPPEHLPRQRECEQFYGTPGRNGTVSKRLRAIELPFDLRIDWNLRQKTNKITVHEKCAPSLHKALITVHDVYGYERMRKLGLDRYAGAYNPRKMRGGSSWSMHAYGCAIDFYAQPNGLRTRCPNALFCKAEYKDFLDIMERNGWLPAIRLWGRDAMHFQRARL